MRRRGTKRKLAWLDGVTLQNTSVAQSSFQTLIDNGQVEEWLDGDGTVLRIVGDYCWIVRTGSQNQGGAHIFVNTGILVTQADVTGAPPPAANMTPFDSTGIQYPWLWTRQFHVQMFLTGANQGDTGFIDTMVPVTAAKGYTQKEPTPNPDLSWNFEWLNPVNPLMDIRVKRRLKTGQQLIWYTTIQVGGANVVQILQNAQLRVLTSVGRR